MRKIQFYFDFLSPYAYLASQQIVHVAERANAIVELRPIVLAALLNHHGHKGPAEIESKRIWVFKEVVRRAALSDIAFGLPHTHPFNPLMALRAILACPPAHRHALCHRLWSECWGGRATLGLEHPDTIVRCADAVGLDGQSLLKTIQIPEIKQALKQETEDAIGHGVFGVPTFRVENELFWGFDSLDLLTLYLQGNDPLPQDVVGQIMGLPASAKRT